MAYVGEMQYLTIGSNTYSLPSSGGSGTVTSVGVSNDTNGGLSISGSPVTSSGTITIGHSNVLTSAQSTQAVYPITIDKNGHISAYGSAVTVPSITLNGSSTTSPSFYAPTGAGTNGYVLKSNGSGAPSWTSAVLTDNKVSTSAVTSGTTYYPTLGSDTTSAETKYYDATGFKYHVTTGTSSSIGYSALTLGNHIASGTAGNKIGEIDIYSSSTHFISLTAADSLASDREIVLPDKNGTIALTDDISGKIDTAGTGLSKSGTTLNHSNSVTAKTTQAVYPIKIDAQGHISAYGSAVTIPTKVSDLTNDSGFVTTDEKLQVSGISNNTSYNFVCMTTVGATPRTSTALLTDELQIKKDTTNSVTNLSVGYDQRGQIKLNCKIDGNHYTTTLTTSHTNANRTLTLPDATGTVALTSDIPTVPTNVSAFTNDAGYVTTDTKNTAGSTNSSSKIYLIGAQSQAANPQTYSNSNLYYNNGFYSREHTNHSDSYIEQTAGKVMISGVDTEYSMQSTVDVHTNYISLLCEMDDAQLGQTEFEFKVNTSDALMSIETTETLYTDIVALGWNSDVITT